MNKSELEKEAEEYGKKYTSRLERKLGFQAGAEFAHREDKKRIVELEKEKAELQYQLNKNPCVRIPEWYCSDCLKENEDLRKENAEAKEIIKHLLDWQYDEYKKSETDKELFKVIAEAEQFLNSEVEK